VGAACVIASSLSVAASVESCFVVVAAAAAVDVVVVVVNSSLADAGYLFGGTAGAELRLAVGICLAE